jgi:hypothetical protein
VRRWSRPKRQGSILTGAAAALIAGGLVIAFAPGAGADEGPTITFRSLAGSTVCTSVPDPADVTVVVGVRVTLVNDTGQTSLVDTGSRKTRSLDAGDAVTVRLVPGEHAVRMVPNCPVSGEVEPAMITVVQSPDQQSGGSQGSSPLPRDGSGAGRGGDRSDPGGPTTSAAVGATSGPPTPVGLGVGPIGAGPQPGVLPTEDEVSAPFEYTGAGTPDSGKLVAVVALICIFGVSVGIIRAIRAQRASSVLDRVS